MSASPLAPPANTELSREEKRALLARLLQKKAATLQTLRTAPLSFAQEQLWFLDRLTPGLPVYNIPRALLLAGPLDIAALARAASGVVARHEALRATFHDEGDRPVQTFAPPASVRLPVIDLSGLPAVLRRPAAEALAGEEAVRPFDLARGPLLRLTLVRLAADSHLLLATVHHIAFDGWSEGLFWRELSALYRGLPLSPPLAYADFVRWQRREQGGEAAAALALRWRERLAGAPAFQDLPTARPRPAAPSYRGGSAPVHLPPGPAAALAREARRLGATPFMVHLAVFAALLGRASGRQDLVLGTPVAGRERPELEGTIGLFVNTLALRLDLSGDPGFSAFLGRVRETCLDAYAHAGLPFERLVEELNPERAPGANPLFQTLFAYQTAPPGRLDLPGIEAAPLAQHSRTARVDLVIELKEGEEGLAGIAGRIEYAKDLWDAADLARLAQHWRTLAAGAAATPGERLSALPLLTAAECHQLLSEWNDSARPLPEIASVPGRFLAVVAEGPERTAVRFGADHLSYGELAARAERRARELAGLGLAPDVPEVPVALYLERSPELVVATLAVLLAGGCYVPLDPSHPAERQRVLLADTGAPLLLTLTRHAANAADIAELAQARTAVRILYLDDPAGRIVQSGEAALPPSAGGDQLCYVIYTSGSTGKPKGVGVSHEAVLRLVHGGFVDLGPGDRVGHVSNTAFDAATFELWGALLTGATLVGLAGDEAVTPRGLSAAFAAGRIDALFLTATLFAEVVREDPRAFSPVKAVLFGGEAADPSRVREALQASPSVRLLNGYGPTECTTFAVVHRTGALPADAPRVPIGRPIGNTRALVLDRSLSPQPIGVPGELHLGGAGLARGYLGRPDRTAERFVPDPLSEQPGERLYKTGDLVRALPDGSLDLLGRLDGQVKVRGFRIELGEVEAALSRHPEVAAAAVAVRGTGVEKRLVGYVVPREGGAGESDLPATLRAFLKPLLPEPMIPAVFLTLPSLPRNPNGKLDRAALPAPEGVLSTGAHFVPARTPIEAAIVGFWSELLPVGGRAIGIHDNFFELGGHSLLATRVLSRLLREHGVEVPLRAIFDRPTVAGLAEALAQIAEELALTDRAAAGLVRGPIPRRDASDLFPPLSFAQQRLWFLARLAPESAFYNTPAAVHLEGPLAVSALARSLDEVVRRHEALRTSFPETAGEPRQSIAQAAPVPLPQIDLGALPEATREPEARRLAAAELARPFDLARGPLLRAGLFRLAADDHRLLLSLHHIVSDGWSIGILLRELSLLYGAFATGRPSPLPELTLQYADYAVWQRRRLTGERLDAQLAYWRERLAGLGPMELPADRPRPPVQRFRGARRPFNLAPAATDALRRLAREHRGSLYVALLAGFATLLARLSGQEDLALGSPIANRQQPELEPLIGFFVNTLVLRVGAQGDPPLSALFARLRETALSADAHQDLPFERLVEELNPVRDASRNPLVQAVFALQNTPLPEPVAADVRFALTGVGSTASRFDLFVSLWELDDGLSGYLEYDTDLFAATTAERWCRHLSSLLAALPARPEARLSELPLLSPAEVHQLLREWNPGAVPPPPASSAPTLDRLFAAQAARTPGAPALVVGEERLTYAELARRVERLAVRLAALGVGPEVPVALFLPRTADLVVSMLAILAAGGFYVPLDPAYPAERLAYLAEDSGAALLLTRRELRDRAPAGVRPLLVDEVDGAASAPAPRSLPESLAYLIYTSGSTGRPKAVAIAHASAVRRVEWAHGAYSAEELRAVLAATSLSFDLSVFEIFVPLATGGAVVLADNALALPDLPARDEVTLVNTVPSAVAELLRQEALPRSVRTINLAGEPLPRTLADQVHARPWVERLVNLYGPSEDTTYSTCAQVERESRRAPAIGRPLEGTAAHVLGASGEPLPVGAPGELYLGGAGLARGYLGRPERTAERFLPDPFADRPGARLYRTGDLVRRQPGGELDFLGRLDDQVKVRGFRIELGEVEAALAACPGVAAAAVLARVDGASSPRLVAYVVAGSSPAPSAPSIAALRSALQERLPDFMLPTAWVFLSPLPLTPNGKLDRRALPAPEPERREAAATPPRTPEEIILAQVWAEVLRLPQVGIDDNFFELGGDSIRGVQVVARCREHGLSLAPHLLFRHQTIAALAAALATVPSSAEPAGNGREAAGTPAEPESSLAAEFPEAALSEAELAELFEQLK